MNDTPHNAQDTANQAGEVKQPDATAPSAESANNGSKPQDVPATTSANETETDTTAALGI
jgi:hypothetical protein